MIVPPQKNLGIPARQPITLSNSLTRLSKYLPRVSRGLARRDELETIPVLTATKEVRSPWPGGPPSWLCDP
jgi:hypothetical protein